MTIRPEHASLVAASGKATLSGTLENIVYFGTDTHYHLGSGDGEFIVRQQKPRWRHWPLKGDKVGMMFGAEPPTC